MQTVVAVVAEEVVGDAVQGELSVGHPVGHPPHRRAEVRVVCAHVPCGQSDTRVNLLQVSRCADRTHHDDVSEANVHPLVSASS